jgi:hypothetical protein
MSNKMRQIHNQLHAYLEGVLPKSLKPHTSKIFVALAIVIVLILLGLFFGFRFLVAWFLGTVFLIVFMAAWVVISEFFKKIDN